MATKKKGLGRGLSALLENSDTDITSKLSDEQNPKVAGSVSFLKIAQIETNPFQPRTQFEEDYISDLAESIKQHGIIQPLTVRKLGYDKYQLISGERRFRASQVAGIEEVPAYIRIANDQTVLEMALVENIQRRDLNPIEVAISFQRLIDECSLTQEQLSEKVAKKRSTVANFLRLLKLPAEAQLALQERKISMGHARAIISLENEDMQLAILAKMLEENLSVRKLEELVSETKASNKKPSSTTKKELPTELSYTRDALELRFKTKVQIAQNEKGKGKITIPYKNKEQLNRILEILNS